MADTHASKATEPKPAAPKPFVNTNIADPEDAPKPTPEEAKKAAEAKAEHDSAVDKAIKANGKLAKDGSAQRLEVTMRDGKARYMWVNTVPTRELTEDEFKAIIGMKAS